MTKPIEYNWTDNEIKRVVSQYRKGESPQDIANTLNCSNDAIRNFLKRQNVYQGRIFWDSPRKYTLNQRYFEKIDNEEKAYWLGMLSADGCIESHRVISLQIKGSDRDHLQKFLDHISCDKPIYDCVKRKKPYSRVTLNSRLMVEDLNQIGVVPCKSLIHKWPVRLPKQLQHHYVRGYFDGDGMWSISSNGQLVFGFIGSNSFIPKLHDKLIKNCKMKPAKLIGKKTKTFQKKGNKQAKRFYEYIYSDATIWLERKKNVADSIIL